jgi:DNA-binding cell septation regulator SpoVG
MIKIVDMRIKNMGTLKAYVDIDYYGLIIKGFKIIDSKNGIFLSMPREKGKDGNWYDTLTPADMHIKQELESLVLQEYNKQLLEELPQEE